MLRRIIQSGVVFAAAWLPRGPKPGDLPKTSTSKVIQSRRSYPPAEVLKTPVSRLLDVMFVIVSARGLMATAQIAPIAEDFNVENVVVLFGGATHSRASRRHRQRHRNGEKRAHVVLPTGRPLARRWYTVL